MRFLKKLWIKTKRVVDQAIHSTRVVGGACISGQSHPSQELRIPQRSGCVLIIMTYFKLVMCAYYFVIM